MDKSGHMKEKRNRLKSLINKNYKNCKEFVDLYNEDEGESIKINTFYRMLQRNNESNYTYQKCLKFIYRDIGKSDTDLHLINKLDVPYDLKKEFKLSFQFPPDKFLLFLEMMNSQQFCLEKALTYEEKEHDKIIVSKVIDIDSRKTSALFEELINKLGIDIHWSSINEIDKKENTLTNNALFVYLLAFLKLEYISLKFSTKRIKVLIKQEGLDPSLIEMPFKEFHKPLSKKVRDIQSVFNKHLMRLA